MTRSTDLASVRAGETVNVSIELISENDLNSRAIYTSASKEATAASLQVHDQLQIARGWVEVGPEGQARLKLQDGQLRWLGCRNSGRPTLEVKIVPRPADARSAYLSSREANTVRHDQSCLDDAVRWRQLLDQGVFKDQSDIAVALDLSLATVSKTMAVGEIPQKRLHQMRELPVTSTLRSAYAIAMLYSPRAASEFGMTPDKAGVVVDEIVTEALRREGTNRPMTTKDVEALTQSRLNGPQRRAQSETHPAAFGGVAGLVKTVGERGTIEISFKGLDAKKFADLVHKVRALVEPAEPGAARTP